MKPIKEKMMETAVLKFYRPMLGVVYPVIMCSAEEANLADAKEACILAARMCGAKSPTMYGLYWHKRNERKILAKRGAAGKPVKK